MTAHSGMNAILNSRVYLGCYATKRVGRTTRVTYISACIAGKLRYATYVYRTNTRSGGCVKKHQQSPGGMVVLRKHPKVVSPLQEETGGGFEP